MNWSQEEISQLDGRTRKIPTMLGGFHRNNDIDRLYSPRHKGGFGAKSVEDSFMTRIVLLSENSKSQVSKNPSVSKVVEYEGEGTIRLAKEFEKIYLP